MTRVLLCMFVIFLMSGSATAQIEISFELLKSIYEWVIKVYGVIDKYKNPDKSSENIETILKHVAEVSSKLDALELHLDVKLDEMLNLLISNIKVETSLQNTKILLRHHMSKIDRYFDQSRNYKYGGVFGNQTLQEFSHKVLWSENGMPDLLDEIHDIFMPNDIGDTGLLSLMQQSAMLNILHDCNTYFSAQQQVYYIYIHLLISEMKGLITLHQCYIIDRMFDASGYTYMSELNDAKVKFQNRLKDYYDLFYERMSRFPQHIRRCQGIPPARGATFIELQKFSRIGLLDADTVANDRCISCPKKFALNALSLETNTTITNCVQMGTAITACPAGLSSPHEYLWLQDGYGKHHGPGTSCDKNITITGRYKRVSIYGGLHRFYICILCACSIETNNTQKNDESAIWRISVTDQMSDLWNNKVVTGIKFVTQDNALHLQIREARLSFNGMLYNDSTWKELDIGLYDAGVTEVKRPMQYEPLRHNRKSLYLDDIKAPDGYAITGVRFQLAGDSAFKLQIFITVYDLGTGELSPFGSVWIDASTHPMRPDDYKRKRIQIDMGASDDPIRGSEFKYNLESNKLITFTHTDYDKDAGQTTIPLLDAQPAETQPSFPLGGIGLTFMGRKGFGGYITPRLYTLNVTDYIKYPINHANIPLTTSQISSIPAKVKSEIPKKRANYSHSSTRQSATLSKIRNETNTRFVEKVSPTRNHTEDNGIKVFGYQHEY